MGESDAYNEFFDEARLPESTRRCVRRFYPTLGALLDEPLDALRRMRDPDTGARFLAVGPLSFLCIAINKRKQALGAGHNVAAERLCCDADSALEVELPVSSSNDSMSSVGEEREAPGGDAARRSKTAKPVAPDDAEAATAADAMAVDGTDGDAADADMAEAPALAPAARGVRERRRAADEHVASSSETASSSAGEAPAPAAAPDAMIHSSSRPPEVPPRRGIHDARELEQIYELVFADNAVPMAVVTLDGRFLRTNARFVTSSGFTADELSRVTIFNLTAPAHLHVAFSYMSLVLRGLDPASHLFVCAVTRDAKPAPFALAVSLVTRDGRAQYFSTTLVPLSNVPPQLFANDAERERHGCPPAPRGDDGGRGRRDDRRDDQARGRGAPPGPAGAPRPHPTSGPSTAADRRGAAAARAPGGDEPPPPPRGRDHKQQRHPPAGVRS